MVQGKVGDKTYNLKYINITQENNFEGVSNAGRPSSSTLTLNYISGI